MKSNKNPTGAPNTPTWEKILGLFGFLLLCVGFVYLGWVGLTEQEEPPEIVFHVKEINALETGYLVQIEMLNKGSQSVAALRIQGQLVQADTEPEISNAEVDYVPARSKNHAGLFFSSDPRTGELTIRALGYQEP